MAVLDWIAQHLPELVTAIAMFAVYIGFGVIFFSPFWLSGDISDHERRERVDPFPHGPSKPKPEGT